MEYLWILPAFILYTFTCGFVIHLISDRHNRTERRRAKRLYNAREAIYKAVPPSEYVREALKDIL